MRSSITLAVLLVLAAAPGGRTARGEAPLPALLEEIRIRHDVPALGALTLKADEVREWAVTGVRRRGEVGAVTPDDLWHLGSCTKAMTSVLVARLAEKKIMRWEMTIGEVFPELRRVEGVRAEYLQVTLEQLLTNRGSIPSDFDEDDWRLAWRQDRPLVHQRTRIMIEMLRRPPPVPLGQYAYSNMGFVVAAHMCERVTGRTWETLVRREVFDPLGMTTAGFGAPGARGPHQPSGHTDDGRPADPKHDNPPVLSPAGRVHCRLDDWGRFIAIHMDGTPKRTRYLSEAGYRRLRTPADGPGQRYAMGWSVTERPWGGTVLTHSGSNTMWCCVAWVSPGRDIAVLATCNQAGEAAVKACDEVAGALIRRELERRGAADEQVPG